MIILAWVTLYKHSSPHFHHNKALPTVCEQSEAPLQRDKDLTSVILCFYEIWGTDLHVNTKSELMTGLIAKAAKKKQKPFINHRGNGKYPILSKLIPPA